MSAEWHRLRGQRDYFGGGYSPAAGYLDPENWAYGAWEALAVTLAEPLRKALNDHYDVCEVCPERGFIHCPEGKRLWDLLPAGDRVVIA